jgi:hypothetical protein
MCPAWDTSSPNRQPKVRTLRSPPVQPGCLLDPMLGVRVLLLELRSAKARRSCHILLRQRRPSQTVRRLFAVTVPAQSNRATAVSTTSVVPWRTVSTTVWADHGSSLIRNQRCQFRSDLLPASSPRTVDDCLGRITVPALVRTARCHSLHPLRMAALEARPILRVPAARRFVGYPQPAPAPVKG